MQQIRFVTANPYKIRSATAICKQHNITVESVSLDIAEIQDENGEVVARDKAQKAYDQLRTPLAIVDDAWIIPGLKGFPGPYMKSMNEWFTSEDWLRLTLPLTDRRIILRQYAVYQDADGQKLFTNDITGTLLTELRGTPEHNKQEALVSFNGGSKSVAELRNEGDMHPIGSNTNVWDELAPWLAGK